MTTILTDLRYAILNEDGEVVALFVDDDEAEEFADAAGYQMCEYEPYVNIPSIASHEITIGV